MKRREFNKKAFLASLGLTLLDVSNLPESCTCGGQCYKINDLMPKEVQNEWRRQVICCYLTNEQKSGRWDDIDQYVLYDI